MIQLRGIALTLQFVDLIGVIGATFSTLCAIPQAAKILRDRETRAISLASTAALSLAGICWFTYGVLRADWVLIGSTGLSLPISLLILRLKLRYG